MKSAKRSIQDACKPQSKEEKAVWSALDKIWAKTKDLDEGILDKEVDRAVTEVRLARKHRRRS